MSLLRLAYVVTLRRTIFNWKLEMVLFLGIVLAVALMSSGVIFSDLVTEAALGHAMGQAAPDEANFQVRTFIGREAPATVDGRTSAYRRRTAVVDQQVGARFEPYLLNQARLLESPTFFFEGHPQLELADEIRPRGDIQYLQGLWPDRVELVEGRWPYSDGARDGQLAGGELEVAVDVTGSELLQLGTGDEIDMFPAASFTDPPSLTAEIVGVFRKKDPDAEFWYPTTRDFSYKNERWTITPLFTTEGALLERVVGQYPSLFLDISWSFYGDRQGIRSGDVNDIQQAVLDVKQAVRARLVNGSLRIKLDRVLDEYEDRLLPTRVPLFLILFLVTAILIYYLGLLCGLTVKSRSNELAMLKSRGATTPQLGLLALVESLVLAAPAVAVGVFLAQGVVQLLGKVFFDIGGGGELAGVPVPLSSQAFLLGLAGGALAVAGLTGFTLMSSRQGIVEFRQAGARPPQVPFIHRYYLDILLIVLIGLLWWQTEQQDSFLVRSLSGGELKIDYSLLLGKILALVGIGLLALRFFPMVLALVARLSEPVGPSWLVHGLRHVSRDPIVPAVLVVMLMLTTALGVIGSTFSATLEESQRHQALYSVGADFTIGHVGGETTAPLLGLSELAEQDKLGPVIAGAAEVRRTSGSLLTKGVSTASVSILGVDANNFDQVAWYRSDFSDGKPLREVTAALTPGAAPAPDGILLPRDTTSLRLWLQPSRLDRFANLRARLKDAGGRYFDIFVAELGFQGWQRIDAELEPLPPTGQRIGPDWRRSREVGRSRSELLGLSPPYTFLFFYLSRNLNVIEPGALFLSGLTADTPGGEVLIDDFQDLDRWHVLEDYSRPDFSSYAIEGSEVAAPGGEGRSAVFSWASGSVGLWGVRAGAPEGPVPAVVSRSLLETADAGIGDTLNISFSSYTLAFQVAAAVDYFPSLDPSDQAFAVVDLETFNRTVNLHSPRASGGSDELWVKLGDQPGGPEAVTSALADQGFRFRNARLASDLVSDKVDQPLVNAGWGGLLVMVFLVLVLASVSGVMLFSYIETRERRTEFALLRTLGSTTKQLNGVVWFSMLLVAACGIGLGTWVGFQTAERLLPLMDVAEEGARVVPPLVVRTDWTTLLVSYLVLAGGTVLTVVWLAWLSARMEIQRALRIGDA